MSKLYICTYLFRRMADAFFRHDSVRLAQWKAAFRLAVQL